MNNYIDQEKSIGKRLTAFRKEQGITLAALAEKAEWGDASMMSKVLAGRRGMKIRDFLRICDALEVEPTVAIGWTEAPPPPETVVINGITYRIDKALDE